MPLPPFVDIVVVGAGVSGLAAAGHLARAGRDVLVLEASNAVGGRVRTDEVDGLLLDRGFQVYNPAYPEGQRLLDLEALRLRPLAAGIAVALDDSRGRTRRYRLLDPRRDQRRVLETALSGVIGARDATVLLRWATRVLQADGVAIVGEPDAPTAEALIDMGLSEGAIERLLRPFLSGVFLESELQTSRRFADFVLRTFLRATPAVPELGMQRIPEQLARACPHVRLNTPVRRIDATTVHTDEGSVRASSVVVATDPRQAAVLLPGLEVPQGRPCTTLYFLAADGPLTGGEPILVVDGHRRGPLVNAVVMSNAAPAYSPSSRSLVAATLLGTRTDAATVESVRRHLRRLLGADASTWDLVGTYAIDYALPAMPPPHDFRRPVALGEGIFVAGDHRDSGSLQGAMVSGRRAAEAVLQAPIRLPDDQPIPQRVES
jgi:glycine/D-amino acid oxidase-like deaminating enzyme